MRIYKWLFISPLLLLLVSCGGETQDNTSKEDFPTDPLKKSALSDLSRKHSCNFGEEVLEGNQIWIKETGTLVIITADSTTYDPDYGKSHRVLKVYDSTNCELKHQEILPLNISPDFPYFLAEINYNQLSKLVGIRGAKSIYIYAVDQGNLLPGMQPQFLSPRLSEDAQSGHILRLEVWENYLCGFAEDEGAFAFDISNTDAPTPILPIAEFKTSENEYISLFAFPTNKGQAQLALPDYKTEKDQFSINPLFARPQNLELEIPANARNNRYIILRKKDGGGMAIAIDMLNRTLIDLPRDIAMQPAQTILQWARQQ